MKLLYKWDGCGNFPVGGSNPPRPSPEKLKEVMGLNGEETQRTALMVVFLLVGIVASWGALFGLQLIGALDIFDKTKVAVLDIVVSAMLLMFAYNMIFSEKQRASIMLAVMAIIFIALAILAVSHQTLALLGNVVLGSAGFGMIIAWIVATVTK